MQSSTYPRLAIATAISLSFVQAHADDPASDIDGEQLASLDPVVVTAARTPQTTDQLLAATTVLEREDIERSQALDLPELLNRQPGLNMTRNGPFGKNTALFMRGTESDHTLVMIDGMRIGSGTTGSTAFEHLPLHDIERIEIVRGPRSSIYGADAIGGVVQMFTRGESMFEGQRLRGGMMVGRHNTNEITAGIDAGDGDREISLSARKFDTDGIEVHENSAGPNGFESDSASLRYRQELGDRAELQVNGMHARGTVGIANTFNPDADQFTDFVQQTVGTQLTLDATQAWRMNIKAGQTRDQASTFDEDAPRDLTARFDTFRDHVNWSNDILIGQNMQVITGIDLQEDEVRSTTDFDEDTRYNAGAFGVFLWEGERSNLEFSARRDKNEAYGYSTTGGVAGSYRIGTSTRIRGSVGTAFNTPTFNELYNPTVVPGFFGANPDLDPEESVSYEVGLESGTSDYRWGASVFRTEIDDLITYVVDEGMNMNVDEATIDGVELTGTALDVDGWRLQASATWLDPVAKGSDGAEDTKLPRRPQRKLTFDFDRQIGLGSLGVSVRHEGRRFDDAANEQRLNEFTLIDLRVGYELSRNVRVRASIDNVGDQEYETASGFRNLGREYFLRLEYEG